MVQLPSWSRVFIILVMLIGVFVAVPNFWPRDEVIDMRTAEVAFWNVESNSGFQAVQVLLEQAENILNGENDFVEPGEVPKGAIGATLTDGREVRIPLGSTDGIYCAVPAPFFCRQINLGLDLQGGAFASFEVDERKYWSDFFGDIQQEIETLADGDDELFFNLLLDNMQVFDTDDDGIFASFDVLADASAQDIVDTFDTNTGAFLSAGDNGELIVEIFANVRQQFFNTLTDRTIEGLRSRFDAFGISEPIIRAAGPPGRVYVEIPGADGIPTPPTGALSFCSVPPNFSGATGPEYRNLPAANPGSGTVRGATVVSIDRTVPCVETEDIAGASPALEGASAQVNVQLRPSSASIMNSLTRQEWSQGPGARYLAVILDGEVLRFDSFEPNLGTSFRIRGTNSFAEAQELATILDSGALPADIVKLEESKVGPELGAAAIRAGQIAAGLAVLAVLIYMLISYGIFGLFANIALVVNLVLIIGTMSLLGFTLSLPGIAGIVLTVGMAVDANVLVFERMREVWRKTENVGQAIENGYAQALSTILDANITTFIAALVLFFVGKGAIQGFAVTLSIGIVTSIFCALLFTRMLIGFWYGSGRRLSMPI